MIRVFTVLMVATAVASAQTDENAMVSHFRLGQEAAAQKQYARAIEEFRAVLKIDSGVIEARANLGLMYYLSGQYDAAIAELSRVVERSSDTLPAQLFLGISYLRTGRPGQALKPLNRALEIDATNPDALRALFTCELALGDYGRASGALEKISHTGDALEAHYQGAHGYLELAAALTEELAQKDRASAWAHRLAGDLAADRQDWTLAVEEYRKAISVEPGMPDVHESLAAVLRQAGMSSDANAQPPARAASDELANGRSALAANRLADASHAFAAAFAAGKTGPEVKYYLIRTYTLLAGEQFRFLVEGAPGAARTHQIKAELALLRRDYMNALAEYDFAAKQMPDDAGIHEKIGEADMALGRTAAAIGELDAALKLSPGNGRAHYLLGQALLNEGQEGRALTELRSAARYSPGLLEAHALLGTTYMHANKPALAIPELNKALPSDYYGDLHFQLYKAYTATGDTASAQKALAVSKEMRRKTLKTEAAKLGSLPEVRTPLSPEK